MSKKGKGANVQKNITNDIGKEMVEEKVADNISTNEVENMEEERHEVGASSVSEKVEEYTAEQLKALEDAKMYGVVPSAVLTEKQVIREFERVPYIAFKDTGKYKEDLHVRLNGVTVVIQRGKHVMIPRCIKNILDTSDHQSLLAAQLSEQYQEEYNNVRNLLEK